MQNLLELTEGIDFNPERTLLTPHPGEWKKLKKALLVPGSIDDLKQLSVTLAKAGLSAIYKSASPIVLSPGHASFLTLGGNRLGRAGSGDALAGFILGLAALPDSIHDLAVKAQNILSHASRRTPHSQSPLELVNSL